MLLVGDFLVASTYQSVVRKRDVIALRKARSSRK